jgi:hypothetical protein
METNISFVGSLVNFLKGLLLQMILYGSKLFLLKVEQLYDLRTCCSHLIHNDYKHHISTLTCHFYFSFDDPYYMEQVDTLTLCYLKLSREIVERCIRVFFSFSLWCGYPNYRPFPTFGSSVGPHPFIHLYQITITTCTFIYQNQLALAKISWYAAIIRLAPSL